jgi:hypothetical protein
MNTVKLNFFYLLGNKKWNETQTSWMNNPKQKKFNILTSSVDTHEFRIDYTFPSLISPLLFPSC